MSNEDIKRFFKDKEPMNPQKTAKNFLSNQAAREIWDCCKQYAGTQSNGWGTGHVVPELVDCLKELHKLVDGGSNDPLGFFLCDPLGQNGQQSQKVQGVPSGKSGAFVCDREPVDSLKQHLSGDVVQAAVHSGLDELINLLAIERIRERKLNRSTLNASDDDLDCFAFCEGDRVYLIF